MSSSNKVSHVEKWKITVNVRLAKNILSLVDFKFQSSNVKFQVRADNLCNQIFDYKKVSPRVLIFGTGNIEKYRRWRKVISLIKCIKRFYLFIYFLAFRRGKSSLFLIYFETLLVGGLLIFIGLVIKSFIIEYQAPPFSLICFW